MNTFCWHETHTAFCKERRYSNRKLCVVGLDDPHDDTEYAKSRSKDLHDQNLHKQRVILRISESACAASDSNRNATCNVGEPDAAS